jgi:hypothetical protein
MRSQPFTAFDHTRKQVAGIIIALREWLALQFIDSPRQQMLEANLLANHYPQVLDSELIDGLLAEPMAGGDEVRIKSWFAPGETFEFIKSLTSHRCLAKVVIMKLIRRGRAERQ